MSATEEWTSYSVLQHQYKDISNQLITRAEEMKYLDRADVDIDIKMVNEMAADAREISEELYKKIIYSYNMLTEKELSLFTGRQREVLELRMKFKPRKVAEILEITPESVADIYNQAINKIQKIIKQKSNNIPVGLSPQQELIWSLYIQNKKPAEIGKIINISSNTVSVQINRIKKLLTKMPNNN